MDNFKPLTHNNDLAQIIKASFDLDLALDGGWGYSQEEATIIYSLNDIPLSQLEHTFASMRAYGEMNMLLPESERYGSINVNERHREEITQNCHIYHKVTYTITAIKENEYAAFIDEYKEGYGKQSFNMEDHFKRRKEATLIREVTHWFNVSNLN